MTMADVKAANGKDGKPLYMTCNGKVLSVKGPFRDSYLEAKAKGQHSC